MKLAVLAVLIGTGVSHHDAAAAAVSGAGDGRAGREAARRRLVAPDLPGAGHDAFVRPRERPRLGTRAPAPADVLPRRPRVRAVRQGRSVGPHPPQARSTPSTSRTTSGRRATGLARRSSSTRSSCGRERRTACCTSRTVISRTRSSSYGQNAYVTAFDAKTKQRLWRSKALVANAQTFAVTPGYLITGYGFTAEPDWLYLLDRRTGRVVERLEPAERAREDHPSRQAVRRAHVRPRTDRQTERVVRCSASATVPRSRRPSGVRRRRRRRSATCVADGPILLLFYFWDWTST